LWISATSWASRAVGSGLPIAEFSQSPKDIPARRAEASALSRTEGSIPSTLHDTRAVMPRSGHSAGSCQRVSDPPRPLKRQSNFDARRLFPALTFSRYGKYPVNKRRRPYDYWFSGLKRQLEAGRVNRPLRSPRSASVIVP
jgi:hypothetical protein